MILPYLQGIRQFFEAPVTWLLFFLNVFVMLFTLKQYVVGQAGISEIFNDELYLATQGEFYAQYVNYNKSMYAESTQRLVEKALAGQDKEKLQILGSLAVRDRSFLDQVENFSFTGDMVALQWWKEKLAKVKSAQHVHPSYTLGLDSQDISITKWLTYQFVHSGFMHFAGNMLFLLIFGCMIEPIIGSLALLIVYLASGIVAAGTFLYFSGVSSIPLIGASGAVSGIMALFCLMFWNRPVRYIYFLFIPKKGYAGYVYLPGWVAFAMWVITDIAGYMGTLSEFGGVAHTAHLGGEFAGVTFAIIVYLMRKAQGKDFIPKEKLPETLPVGTRVA